ncbi:MAG: metal ABC transporter substrate-binding protein [Oscillospiraceae bacterium]|jgi:zinc transport system substrate-binding protein|nr:metal ABC transporter substrate-binding protein [Oscillospiraceae bacterium]
MKRFLWAALSGLLVCSLFAACGVPDAKTQTDTGLLRVVATIFPPYDFVRTIAGDKADVTMLLPPGSETHSFEPTPQDVLRIQNCDVFIYNGGESDAWVEDILESVDTSGMRIVKFIDCVEVLEEEIIEGMEEEEADAGEEETEIDEHVWTSPRNAKLIVQRISDTLCEADPANAALYKANTETYEAQLDSLDREFQAVVDNAVRKTLIFGDRFPFRYFAETYGLDYYAAFPGCSTETEASPATIKFLIDKTKAEGIPVVFKIELTNGKMAQAIAEATGAKVLELHSCHNLTKADFTAGKSYIDFMQGNLSALKEALA